MMRNLGLVVGMLWAAAAQAQTPTFEQQSFLNIAYYEGKDADPVRHRLDVYVPKGQKDFPVLFFVHGGGWIKGSKDQFGIYTVLARTFNRHGIAVVCPNYRLSPDVQHPEHIRDVARAFAWTYKNIQKYGGRTDEIFVGGHSAGGHLTALLATDDSYLKAEGLSLKAIKGALPVSGLYTIPLGPLFDIPFGQNPKTHSQASPITHVRRDLPPFLVMFGDSDLPYCDRPGADAFCKTMQGAGSQAQLFEVAGRNHLSILFSAINDTDPVTQAMLSFIMAQVALDHLGQVDGNGNDVFGSYLARYLGQVARQGKVEKK
jgi:acetyl esterase/lipase